MKYFAGLVLLVLLGIGVTAEATIFRNRARSVQRVVDHCDHGQVAIRERVVVRDRDVYTEYVEVPNLELVRKEYIVERPARVEKIVEVEKDHGRQNVRRVEKVVEKDRNRLLDRNRKVKVERVVEVDNGHSKRVEVKKVGSY